MALEIQGTPVYKNCNIRNDRMRARYELLEAEKTRILKEIAERDKRLREIEDLKASLNKEEVGNVLDYVRCYARARKLNVKDIDDMLCHCQNKLNGNIDSVFLYFDNPVEDKNENKDCED